MSTIQTSLSLTFSPQPTNSKTVVLACPHCGGSIQFTKTVLGPRHLTNRELQIVITLLEHGVSNKELARMFATTEQVIKNYLSKAYAKLEVTGRTHLAKRWADPMFRAGLLPPQLNAASHTNL